MPLKPPTPPTRYLLASAVITSPGGYRYWLVSPEEARVWLARGPWVSRVGYPETARHIEHTLGVRCLVSREITRLRPGDEALVVRLTYRPQDPRMKREQREEPPFSAEDWEIGLLTRFD